MAETNEKKTKRRRRMSTAEKTLGPLISLLRPLKPEERERVVKTALVFLGEPAA